MCTLSWRLSPRGYDLFFNRDELHTRAPESAPVQHERDGLSFIAPRDGDHGGTWLASNAGGFTIALLNDYGASWTSRSGHRRRSRGHIVWECATATSLEQLHAKLQMQPLADTPPFHLFGFQPGQSPLGWHWDGQKLSLFAPVPPVSSSSFDTSRIIAARILAYRRQIGFDQSPALDQLLAYHLGHDTGAPADSVLMSRPDASTRSITHVHVDDATVQMAYQAVATTHLGSTRILQMPRRLEVFAE